MNTTLLCFDFTCTQTVPFYQHLCNILLTTQQEKKSPLGSMQISIDNGYLKNGQYRYRIEAQGTQTQLEILADNIATDFLLSVHLVSTRISSLEKAQGSRSIKALKSAEPSQITQKHLFKKNEMVTSPLHELIQLDYCAHCAPLFGDNQSPKFSQIDFPCPCCQGEEHYQVPSLSKKTSVTNLSALGTLTQARLFSLAQTLLSEHIVTIDELGITLTTQCALLKCTKQLRPQILICNPNTLNQFFNATHEQVITLSCFEKPAITLTTKGELQTGATSKINAPSCDVRFAYNRALIIVTEYLRQKGIDWLYYRSTSPIAHMAFIEKHWIWLQQPHSITLKAIHDTLHDNTRIGGHQAEVLKERIIVHKMVAQPTHKVATVESQEQAFNALYASQLAHSSSNKKDTVAIFLSRNNLSQIVTSNSIRNSGKIEKDKAQNIFTFPELPNNGADIIAQLRNSIKPNIEGNLLTSATIIDKFQHAYPAQYNALLTLRLSGPRQNLTSLLVVAATLLGLSKSSALSLPQSNQQSVDRLLAYATLFQAEHSPRIDFPKISVPKNAQTSATHSFDWCQTFKSLICFRLAQKSQKTTDKNDEDAQIARLAFGFLDSLADDISSWIEEADHQIGIKNVLLAGDEFQYSVFTRRLCRRLASNYSIHASWNLDLEGANLAAGALYLPRRRKFS
ncbi:hypothetical protein JI57_02005 [Psychromonas sp. PRT-SC03]|nr:hypothetical protein JI57_02005 [Psychromonas sp. PRT-SC03]